MKFIVGIDEVGRGPLAGPVTVCVVACEEKMYNKLKRDRRLPPTGKDSKKLSPLAREKYATYLKLLVSKTAFDMRSQMSKAVFDTAIVHISNKVIDAKGISFAIKKAITEGIKKLKLNPRNCRVLLDGGLKAPKQFKNQRTIRKGDEKEKIIAWASILAKVSRDELMHRAAKKFPRYGFENHKGYGTLKHRLAISKYGISVVHRVSYCRNLSFHVFLQLQLEQGAGRVIPVPFIFECSS